MGIRLNIWSFGLCLLITLFYIGAFFQSTLAWAPFAVVILLMISEPKSVRVTRRDLNNIGWFLLLMTWAYASLIWSIDKDATVTSLRNLIPKLVIVFFAYKFPIYQKDKVERLGLLVLGIASFLAVYFIFKFGAIRITASENAAYKISYANLIAAAVVASIPLIYFNKRRGWLTVPNMALVMGAYVVIRTESRAGFILAAFAFALSSSFFKSVRMTKFVYAMIVGVFLMFAIYYFIQSEYPAVAERIDTIGETLSVISGESASSISKNTEDYARKVQIVYTVEKIRQLPILGVGYGAFGAAIESDTGKFVQAHSLFGTFFVELGLVGFLLFLIFNVKLFVSLLRNANDVDGPDEAHIARMAFVALILVNILFLARPQMSEVTYFVVLGLAMAAGKRPLRRHVYPEARMMSGTC